MGVQLPVVSSPGAAAEVRWARGVQSGRADSWTMAFQIRGKRHALTLRCGQAEAAVGCDLAGFWSHRAKGNNPEACTRYNFALMWYPKLLLENLLALADWEAVKAFLSGLAASGALRRLVPFDGAGRRYEVANAESMRPHANLLLLVNARGVHLYRGSWTCVPMEDVDSFGCAAGLLRICYTLSSGRQGRLGATTVTLRCSDAPEAYRELQSAAARRAAAGLRPPRDLGTAIPPPHGGAKRGVSRPPAPKAGAWGEAGCDGGSLSGSEEEAGDPSPEELELLTEFADLARSTDPSPRSGSASGASNSGATAPAVQGGHTDPAGGAAAPEKAAGCGAAQPGADNGVGAAAGWRHSPSGSSSSSRAGGKPVGSVSAAKPCGGTPKRSLLSNDSLAAPDQSLEKETTVGADPTALKKPRLEQSAASAAAAAPLSPQQQLLAAQQQMQMLQMLQFGMAQMMPLAAVPPHLAAAYRQQQAAAAAGGAGGSSPLHPASLPCFPFQHHPGMVVVPVMVAPGMAAAMQAQAARHAQAAAAAAQGGGSLAQAVATPTAA